MCAGNHNAILSAALDARVCPFTSLSLSRVLSLSFFLSLYTPPLLFLPPLGEV